MIRQCLGCHPRGYLGTLREEMTARSSDGDTRQRGVDWRVRIDATCCKLKAIYPKINQLQSTSPSLALSTSFNQRIGIDEALRECTINGACASLGGEAKGIDPSR